MALQFPANPVLGTTYLDWIFDGTMWVCVTPSANRTPMCVQGNVTNPQGNTTSEDLFCVKDGATTAPWTETITAVGPMSVSPGLNWSAGGPTLNVDGQVNETTFSVYAATHTMAGVYAETITAGPAAGFSNGLYIKAGTDGADRPLVVEDANGNPVLWTDGAATTYVGPPTTPRTTMVVQGAVNQAGALWVEGGANTVGSPPPWTAVIGDATAAAGASFGLLIQAGTNVNDYAWRVLGANGTEYGCIRGDGSGCLGPFPNQLIWDSMGVFSTMGSASLPGGGAGAGSLATLSDVSLTAPSQGQVLMWDATASRWVNATTGGGGGPVSLGSLSDVSIATPAIGQALMFNGTSWVNQALPIPPGGIGTVTAITAGTGLTGGTITTSGIVGLSNTTVAAGTYNAATLTVDPQGRLTAASAGNLNTVVGAMTPHAGDVLMFNGARWINVAGTGVGNALASLSDVSVGNMQFDQVLSWNGAYWTNRSLPLHTLASLDDTTIAGATYGQVLTWDGTKWINQNPPTPGGGATGLNMLADVQITNVQDNQLLAWSVAANHWINVPYPTLASLGDVTITGAPAIAPLAGRAAGLVDGSVLTYSAATSKWVDSPNPLPNFAITSPTNGQTLVYDQVNAQWVNATGGSAVSISRLGSGVFLQSGLLMTPTTITGTGQIGVDWSIVPNLGTANTWTQANEWRSSAYIRQPLQLGGPYVGASTAGAITFNSTGNPSTTARWGVGLDLLGIGGPVTGSGQQWCIINTPGPPGGVPGLPSQTWGPFLPGFKMICDAGTGMLTLGGGIISPGPLPSIQTLSDVNSAMTLTTGDVLTWVGDEWSNVPGGGGGGLSPLNLRPPLMAAIGAGDAITTSNNTIYINGVGANAGDVLTWNGTAWGHAAPTGGGGGGVSLSTPNTWTAPQTFNAPVQPLVVQSQIPDTVNRSGLLSFLGPANVPPGQMANNGSQEWTIGIPQPSSPLSFAIRPPGATSNALGINVSANVAYVSIPNLTASTLGVAQLNAGRINSPGSVNFWGSPDPASGLPQIYELDLSTGTDFTVDLAPVYNAVFNAGGPYTAQLLLTNLNNVANSNIRITISQPDFVGPPASVGGIDTFIGMVTLPAFEPGAQMPMSDGPPIIWGGSGFFPSSSPAAATSDFIQLTVWGSDPLYTNNPNKFVVSGKFSTASSGRGTLPSSTDIFGTGTAGQTVKWITSPAAGWVAGWIFQPIRKGQATTLTSNATLTPDPHLSVMATPTMNKFEVFVGISNAGATGMTPGFQFQMNFGGTLTNNNVNGLIYEISYVGSPTISGGLALNTPSGGIGLANGASNWLHITGTVTAATSGWLSFQWAQATADAAGVTVLPGSYLIITPLQ